MPAHPQVTAREIMVLMEADFGLTQLKATLAAAGFEMTKTTARPRRDGGITARVVWRKRRDGDAVVFNGTFRYSAPDLGLAREAIALANGVVS